jgi:hypothetical protein
LVPIGIIASIGLFFFPWGTVINGYILWLLFSSKGRFVMSPEYQEVIAATPHMKHRTSIVVILLGILLLVVLGSGLMWVSFAP